MKFFLVGVFVLLVLGVVSQVYMHELVHVQNFKSANIDSQVVWGFTGAVTVPSGVYANETIAQQTVLANSFNEAVAYNVTPLFFMLCGVIVLCALYVKKGEF